MWTHLNSLQEWQALNYRATLGDEPRKAASRYRLEHMWLFRSSLDDLAAVGL